MEKPHDVRQCISCRIRSDKTAMLDGANPFDAVSRFVEGGLNQRLDIHQLDRQRSNGGAYCRAEIAARYDGSASSNAETVTRKSRK